MSGLYRNQTPRLSHLAAKAGSSLTICLLMASLLLTGCSSPQQAASNTKTTTTTSSKAGQETTLATTTTTAATTAATTSQAPTATPTPLPEPPSAKHPAIALTFDDGPSLKDTGKLLDLLAAEDVKVTFFVLGEQIAAGRQSLVKREFDEGHEIAGHTYSHLNLAKASAKTARDELTKTNKLIEQITGQKTTLMRPPLGAFNDTTKSICKDLGLALISWSWQSCPEDWNHRGEPALIANYVISKAANGHIVLLHDTNSTTVEAMPAMIKGLKKRGFRFMTVSELLAYGGKGEPQAGKAYYQLSSN
jgi:peptidoglycan/xylan/chitin deacetylase (PgdA/CDA1 family)